MAERRGLAVDHLSRLIFYTDLNNAVIGMLSIGRCLAKLIVSTDLRRPHGIALDMMNGYNLGTLCSPPLLVVYTHVRCVCVCVFVFICVYACVDGHASVYIFAQSRKID